MGRAACVLVLWSSVAVPASGQAAEAIRVEWSAVADGCPDLAAFLDRVRARTDVALAAEGETARLFRVTVVPLGDRVDATLEVIEADGSTTSRSLAGSSCDEVVSGVALAAALAIEERSLSEQAASPITAVPAPSPPEPVATPPPPPPPVPATVVRWWVGAGFELGLSFLPGALPGASASVALRREPIDRFPSIATPAFRIAIAGAGGRAAAEDGERGRFRWWTARIEGCPVSFVLARAVAVEPCVLFQAGALAAAGDGVEDARSETRPWAAAGAVARASFRFAAGLGLELGAGVEAPFVRDRFHFASGQVALRVPAVVYLLDLGLSWTFS